MQSTLSVGSEGRRWPCAPPAVRMGPAARGRGSARQGGSCRAPPLPLAPPPGRHALAPAWPGTPVPRLLPARSRGRLLLLLLPSHTASSATLASEDITKFARPPAPDNALLASSARRAHSRLNLSSFPFWLLHQRGDALYPLGPSLQLPKAAARHGIQPHTALFRLSEGVCVSRSVASTLGDPIDCSPPSSSLHGILQARILEWIAMPSSREVN